MQTKIIRLFLNFGKSRVQYNTQRIFCVWNCPSCVKQFTDMFSRVFIQARKHYAFTPCALATTRFRSCFDKKPSLVTSVATSFFFYSLSVFYRDFDVEGDSQDCPDDSDFTEVYNGIASWSKIIGRYCGSVIPPAITSDSNKLRIEFHSNTQYAGRGFDAMYSLKVIGEQGIYMCYYY